MKQGIIEVLGWSNSGKTTFIEHAILTCTKHGLFSAAIKKSRHEPSYPSEGKDSGRYLFAGAQQSLFISEHSYLYETLSFSSGICPLPNEKDENNVQWAFSLVNKADIIFCEGLRLQPKPDLLPNPCIAFIVLTGAHAKTESELKFPLRDIDILITDSAKLSHQAQEYGKKAFSANRLEACIEYILKYLE